MGKGGRNVYHFYLNKEFDKTSPEYSSFISTVVLASRNFSTIWHICFFDSFNAVMKYLLSRLGHSENHCLLA